jgi:hypothetical protein
LEILQLNGFLWSGENLKGNAIKTRVKTEPKLGHGSEKTVVESVVETVVESSVKVSEKNEIYFGRDSRKNLYVGY